LQIESDIFVESATKRLRIGPIVQVAAGNALEVYDLMIYGYYARYIAHSFFPSNNGYISLMLALMTFAVGFLARPFGAIVLGAYTDRHGRRKGLLLSLTLMCLGILSLACTPSYTTIGLAAPLIVVAGRLLQGFSAGAELGGTVVYLAEIAPPNRRAFYMCWQLGSQQFAVMGTALIGLVLLYTLTPDQLRSWGWRIPLLLGCVVMPIMFWLRANLTETEVFARKKTTPTFGEIYSGLTSHWRIILLSMSTYTFAVVSSQTIQTYAPTYVGTLHLGALTGFVTLFFVGLTTLLCLPVMAMVADRVNRRSMLIVVSLAAAITAYPLLAWLAAAPSVFKFVTFELWFSFMFATYSSALSATIIELVPAQARTASISFAQAVSAAVFGGFTPAILTWLDHSFNNKAMGGAWLAVSAVIGLIAALIMDKRKVAAAQRVKLQ
jgi:MHS family citrate/tricarballylate:H+ symporter-like MFS transporter